MVIKVLNEFLPQAEEVKLGAIKVGETLNIDSTGTLNLQGEVTTANKVTNCITEIPQDIKLELNNGTLTLKAGSKYYAPDGTQYQTTADKTTTYSANGKRYIGINLSSGSLFISSTMGETCSGTTDTLIGTPWHTWFDTTNSAIYRYEADGTTQAYAYSIPLGIVTVSNDAISSIDRVFNGAGYIGHHAFVLPGVQALISNGFAEDGTLKNIEYTSTKLAVLEMTIATTAVPYKTCNLYTPSSLGVWSGRYIGEVESLDTLPNASPQYYVKTENKVYRGDTKAHYTGVWFIRYKYNGTSILIFDINLPLKVVTDSDDMLIKAQNSRIGRSLSDRFGEIINVKDFGAIGDGITDDTTAIQAAIDSAHWNSSGIRDTIFFPPGTYKVSTINIVNGQSVILSHPTLISESTALIINNGWEGTIVEYGKITAKDCGIWIQRGKNVQIEHTRINITHGYANSSSVYGIHIGGVSGLYAGNETIISDCSIYVTSDDGHVDGYGLYVQGADDQFNNLVVYGFKYGIYDTSGANSYSQVHCWINGYQGGTEQERINSILGSAALRCYRDTAVKSFYADSFQYGIWCTDTAGEFQHKVDGFLIYHSLATWPIDTTEDIPLYVLHCGSTYHPESWFISNLDVNWASDDTHQKYFSDATSGYTYDPKFYSNNPHLSNLLNAPTYSDSLIAPIGIDDAGETKLNALTDSDTSSGWLGFSKNSSGAVRSRIVLPQNTSFNETAIALNQDSNGGTVTTPNIEPATTNAYSLGSQSKVWKDIYVTTPPTGDDSNKVPTTAWVKDNIGKTSSKTNCLTEIPQDIKLELDNGTLTLKAGSKVYVPNGSGVFDVITTTEDLTLGPVGTYTGSSLLFVKNDGTQLIQQISNTSGTTAPSGDGAWYDTTNNLVKIYSGGSDSGVRVSLPIAIVHRTSGSWDSIEQVFNGFGCIGSTAFALPNVSGLVPNGRNADGTLKNIPYTVPSVIVRTWSYQSSNQPLCLNPNTDFLPSVSHYYASSKEPCSPSVNYVLWYNPDENIFKYSGSNGVWTKTTDYLPIGIVTSSDTATNNYKLTQFTKPKTVFHALDWNDKRTIKQWTFPDYSSQVSRSKDVAYTADTDGWLYFYGGGGGGGGAGLNGSAAVTLNGSVVFNMISQNLEGRVYHSHLIPLSKGTTYIGTTSGNNPVLTMYWYKCLGE